jgi:hypothetical protein
LYHEAYGNSPEQALYMLMYKHGLVPLVPLPPLPKKTAA